MTCPQCGGTLATYALGRREASVCEDCGYVGIAAEHRGDPRTIESWNDALRRFYRAHGSDEAPSVELQPPLSRPASGSADEGESWDEALRRFYARRAPEATGGESETAEETADTSDTDEGPAEETADTSDTDDEPARTTDEDSVEADAGG